MILIKGGAVQFETTEGKRIALPESAVMMHDPEGRQLPKCEVFFGPHRILKGRTPLSTRAAEKYFGWKYEVAQATVNVPDGPWHPVAHVVKIFYVRGTRRGNRAPGGYHHPFKRAPLTLEKCKRYYRLSLPNNCIVDDRGFVFP